MRSIPILVRRSMRTAVSRAMEAMSKTGPEHAALSKDAGTWTVKSTMWMAPGAPPMTSAGTSTITSILDG